MSDGLERHAVHQSLLRTPLFAGVDLGILLIEVSFGVAVLLIGGFSVISLAPALVVVGAVHIPIRRLLAADPAMIAIIPTALRYQAFYPPLPQVRPLGKRSRRERSIHTEA